MGAQLGSKGSISDINMTPLIDIVLVVLIIMMVNIPIQIEEMGIKIPGNTEAPPRDEPPKDQLVIAVYEDGKLALNRRLMTENVLLYELTRRLRPMQKKRVFVDGHPMVGYAAVVDMVDLAREAGAAKVGLARLKEEGPQEATSVHPGAAPRGITFGSPKVVGRMKASVADEQIQPYRKALMGCYEQQLMMNSELSGTVSLQIDVAPDGSLLSEPEIVRDVMGSQPVADCVLEVGQQLSFADDPPGEGETARILYNVLFSPG